MTTVDQLKAEASARGASWRDNGERLIWCGKDGERIVFRNTTDALRKGPIVSEAEAARLLADGGTWHGPSA